MWVIIARSMRGICQTAGLRGRWALHEKGNASALSFLPMRISALKSKAELCFDWRQSPAIQGACFLLMHPMASAHQKKEWARNILRLTQIVRKESSCAVTIISSPKKEKCSYVFRFFLWEIHLSQFFYHVIRRSHFLSLKGRNTLFMYHPYIRKNDSW